MRVCPVHGPYTDHMVEMTKIRCVCDVAKEIVCWPDKLFELSSQRIVTFVRQNWRRFIDDRTSGTRHSDSRRNVDLNRMMAIKVEFVCKLLRH